MSLYLFSGNASSDVQFSFLVLQFLFLVSNHQYQAQILNIIHGIILCDGHLTIRLESPMALPLLFLVHHINNLYLRWFTLSQAWYLSPFFVLVSRTTPRSTCPITVDRASRVTKIFHCMKLEAEFFFFYGSTTFLAWGHSTRAQSSYGVTIYHLCDSMQTFLRKMTNQTNGWFTCKQKQFFSHFYPFIFKTFF